MSRSGRLTEQERDERRQADRDRLEHAVRELLSSDGWARWVRVRASNGLGRYTVVIWGACVRVTHSRAVVVGDMSSAARDTGVGRS